MSQTVSAKNENSVSGLKEQLEAALIQNEYLQNEVSDLNLMYENLMEHGVAVEDQLADQNIALERMQKRLKAELAEAANYVQSTLPPVLADYPKTQWKFVSSSELGGDSFGYHWIDDDNFGVYLLDVCGHGVGAALLAVTAINVLRTGALRDVDVRDPGQVLTRMNVAFDMTKQNDVYFTLWYGVYCTRTRELRYASGGHPPAILVSGNGDTTVAQKLGTQQLIIGGMPNVKFFSKSCTVPENSRLFVFSDGTFELRKPEGGIMKLDDFVGYLARMYQGSSYDMDHLVSDLRKIQNSYVFEDDFSLVQIDL